MTLSRRKFIESTALAGMATLISSPILAMLQNQKSLTGSANKPYTVLFQGDSITDGNRTRNNDWNHVIGHGYAFLIASEMWFKHPESNLMFYNRGISGNRVKDLQARWQADAIDLQPDLISILIGVNDIIAMVNDDNAEPIDVIEQRYRALLDTTKKELPNCDLVICEPFTLPGNWLNNKPDIWAKQVPLLQELVRRLADDYDATFVALQKPFNEACSKAPATYWIWDGIHPMPAGHALFAQEWMSKVQLEKRFK